MTTKTVGFIGGKFLPLHTGHLYCITKASTYVDELYVILTSSKVRDHHLCKSSQIPYISPEIRLSWLGGALSKYNNIHIAHIEDVYDIENYNWEEGATQIKQIINHPITHVFSSEPSYTKKFQSLYPEAQHIIIDSKKSRYPVSSTQIRANQYQYWNFLPKFVKPFFVKKVVVIGTESCGKSTLVRNLAQIYQTTSVHEIGRDYCEQYKNQLTSEMFDSIAMEHYLLQETQAQDAHKILFVDTEAIITQYYLQLYCNTTSSFLETLIKKQKFDLWLFMEPDVSWIEDGYRFAGDHDLREKNNRKLKQMLKKRQISFTSINGTYPERLNKAIQLIDHLFEL